MDIKSHVSSDSDSSYTMKTRSRANSKNDNNSDNKNDVLKITPRACDKCTIPVKEGTDMYRYHKTGWIVCKECWLTIDPGVRDPKQSWQNSSETKICSVFLKDILIDESNKDQKSHKIQKEKRRSPICIVQKDIEDEIDIKPSKESLETQKSNKNVQRKSKRRININSDTEANTQKRMRYSTIEDKEKDDTSEETTIKRDSYSDTDILLLRKRNSNFGKRKQKYASLSSDIQNKEIRRSKRSKSIKISDESSSSEDIGKELSNVSKFECRKDSKSLLFSKKKIKSTSRSKTPTLKKSSLNKSPNREETSIEENENEILKNEKEEFICKRCDVVNYNKLSALIHELTHSKQLKLELHKISDKTEEGLQTNKLHNLEKLGKEKEDNYQDEMKINQTIDLTKDEKISKNMDNNTNILPSKVDVRNDEEEKQKEGEERENDKKKQNEKTLKEVSNINESFKKSNEEAEMNETGEITEGTGIKEISESENKKEMFYAKNGDKGEEEKEKEGNEENEDKLEVPRESEIFEKINKETETKIDTEFENRNETFNTEEGEKNEEKEISKEKNEGEKEKQDEKILESSLELIFSDKEDFQETTKNKHKTEEITCADVNNPKSSNGEDVSNSLKNNTCESSVDLPKKENEKEIQEKTDDVKQTEIDINNKSQTDSNIVHKLELNNATETDGMKNEESSSLEQSNSQDKDVESEVDIKIVDDSDSSENSNEQYYDAASLLEKNKKLENKKQEDITRQDALLVQRIEDNLAALFESDDDIFLSKDEEQISNVKCKPHEKQSIEEGVDQITVCNDETPIDQHNETVEKSSETKSNTSQNITSEISSNADMPSLDPIATTET